MCAVAGSYVSPSSTFFSAETVPPPFSYVDVLRDERAKQDVTAFEGFGVAFANMSTTTASSGTPIFQFGIPSVSSDSANGIAPAPAPAAASTLFQFGVHLYGTPAEESAKPSFFQGGCATQSSDGGVTASAASTPGAFVFGQADGPSSSSSPGVTSGNTDGNVAAGGAIPRAATLSKRSRRGKDVYRRGAQGGAATAPPGSFFSFDVPSVAEPPTKVLADASQSHWRLDSETNDASLGCAFGDGLSSWGGPCFGEKPIGAAVSDLHRGPAAGAPAEALAPLPFAAEEQHAAQGRFADAIKGMLARLDGSDDNVQLIRGHLVRWTRAWENADLSRVRSFDSEKCSMTASLQAARETTRHLKEEKVRLEHLRADEARRCLQAEANAVQMRQRLAQDARDLRFLREKLARAEAAEVQTRLRPTPCTKADVVKRLAEFECVPLRSCEQHGLAALRKKILLKWHPDKQPSTDHAALATQVMQELQNRPEWSW